MKSAAPEKPAARSAAAKPIIRRSRLPIFALWLIPVAALVAAGFYFHDYLMDHGPMLTVTFADASGLNPGQTPLEHLGVPIGQVAAIGLSDDQRQVRVQIRLRRGQDAFARKAANSGSCGRKFPPPTSAGCPLSSAARTSKPFPAPARPRPNLPASIPPNRGPGLELIAFTNRLEHLQADSPIYFRGIQVGVVENIELKPDSTGVLVHLFIWRRYSQLVRSSSHFWLVSGADVKGGILTGIQMKIDSLRSIISGGVAFATPDAKTGEAAKDGDQFPLYNDADPDWLKWSGPIPVESIERGESSAQSDRDQGEQPTGISVKAK